MRRWLSISLIALASLVSVVLLAIVAGFWWVGSDSGRDTVLRMATDAAKDTGLSLTLQGIDGSLLGELTIAEVAIDDADGRWLEGSNLKLAWHPWQLLGGRLHIREVSVESIALTRAPNLPPSEEQPSETTTAPSIPVRIDLDRLAVARFELGDAILGLATTTSIDAQATVARHEGKLGFHVKRLDAPGVIELDANFDVPRDELILALHAEEPGGGLIAEMAGLEGKPPIRIDLDGEGPLSQWRGQLRAAIDNADWAVLNVNVDGRTIRTVTIDGHIGTQPLAAYLPEDLVPLIGPEITIAGKTIIDPDRLHVETLEIGAHAAVLATSGTYGFAASDWNGAVRLLRLAPEVATHFGFSVDRPDLAIEARSSSGKMDATLRMAASQFGTQGASVSDLQASVEASQAKPSAPWDVTLAANGQVTGLPGEPSDANAKLLGLLSVSGHALVEPSAARVSEFRFELGPATLTAAGEYRNEQADAKLTLDVSDLRPLLPSAQSEAPVGAHLATTVHYGTSDGLAVNDLTLDLPGGQIVGQASLDAAFEKIDATFKMAGLDLAPIASLFGQQVSGRLTMTSSITGAVADPSAVAQASLQNGSYSGSALPPAEFRANISTAVSVPSGEVALTARPPQGAVSISTRLAMVNSNTLNLQDIRLSGPKLAGDGQIRLTLDRVLTTGQINVAASDLSPMLAIAGLSGGGSAKLRVSLSTSNNTQQADLTGTVGSVSVAQKGNELARIGRANFSAKGAVAGNSPITAKLSANSIYASGAEIGQLTLDARGTADLVNFDLRASAPAYEDLKLGLAGVLQTKGDTRTIRLTRGGGSVRNEPFTIQSGMTATIAPNVYQLRGFVLSTRNLGQVAANGGMNKQRIEGNVTAKGVPLSLLNGTVNEGKFLGQIDLTANLGGTVERPTGQVNLTARDLAIAEDRAGRKANVTTDLTVDDKAASLQVAATGLSEVPLTVNTRLARSQKGLGFDNNAALSGRVAWHGAVGEITKFAPLVGQQVTGDLVVDLTLSGTLGAPGVTGAVSMSNGSVEDYATGVVLRFPRLEIAGSNRRIDLRPFEATDQSDGKISGRGTVDLDTAASFPFQAQLEFAKARVLNRDDIIALLSGTIAAEGSLAKANIRGNLQTDRVEVDLDTGMPPSVATLDVEEIPADGTQGEAQQQASAQSKPAQDSEPSEFLLDVKLNMPGQVFVRGRGLESEWEGNVAVAGSIDKPRVTGKITSRRGQFDFLDKLFRLQPSVIDLAPTADGGVDTLLNIKTTAEMRDLIVTVAVSGTAAKPSIKLSSTPTLPQDEILSRLLFDKSRASLSPLEAVQLASALSSLSGGGGPSLMSRLRRGLGVDVLRVDSGGGEAGPSLEAGKYVSDRIYMGVKQGATPQSSAVAVDVDVFRNMSVGSEVRQDGSNRVGLKYKWDY